MSLCKSGGLVDPGLVLTIAHDELDKRSVNRKSQLLTVVLVPVLYVHAKGEESS
jgi:hypothetical protein